LTDVQLCANATPIKSNVLTVGYYEPHHKSTDIIPGVNWQPLLHEWIH